MLDQENLGSGLGRSGCGRHAGGAATGDDDVGVGVPLVVVAVRGVGVDGAAGSERGQHLLVGRPELLRVDEGLVVEAGGQEPADELVRGLGVVVERRPHVLWADGHPGFEEAVG